MRPPPDGDPQPQSPVTGQTSPASLLGVWVHGETSWGHPGRRPGELPLVGARQHPGRGRGGRRGGLTPSLLQSRCCRHRPPQVIGCLLGAEGKRCSPGRPCPAGAAVCADRTGRGAAREAELQADRRPAPSHPPDGHCHGVLMGARVTLGGHGPAPVPPRVGGAARPRGPASEGRAPSEAALCGHGPSASLGLALQRPGQHGHPQDHGAPQPRRTLPGLGTHTCGPHRQLSAVVTPTASPPPPGQGQSAQELRPTLAASSRGAAVGAGQLRPHSPRADSRAQNPLCVGAERGFSERFS